MLVQQQKLLLSSYTDLYDLIVLKANLLRKINELIIGDATYSGKENLKMANEQDIKTQMNFQESDYFKEKSKQRGIVKLV
jgi:hypothetical protein